MVSLLHFQWSLRNGERVGEAEKEGEREREWTAVNKWYFHCNSFSLVETRREKLLPLSPLFSPFSLLSLFSQREKEGREGERRGGRRRKGDQCPTLVQPGRETWIEGRGKGINSIKTPFPLIPMGPNRADISLSF